jgi:general stress protein YciG
MAQKSQGTGTSNRGFASMDAAKQREIASKGGQSVPAAKRSFSQDRRLAAEAGRKGGQSSHGGGRKQTTETEQVSTTAAPNPMAAEREEHRETARGEPEKVDSH